MLHFFRTYQRYVFIFITVVIVISFSFFGTYNAIERSTYDDPTVFTAIDGTPVKRSELEKMNLFIGSDMEEKRNYGGMWGPNFLNDGVLKKDFFENGIAQILFKAYASDLKDEISQRHHKEKLYEPYTHPQANFISAEAAWNYLMPGMKQNYTLLTKADDPLAPEAVDARINLFLGQSRFTGPMLRNMLYMQEKQFQWIEHDPSLDYSDLSLYGYHRAEDWFGPSFMRLASEFIINSAIIAKQRGYTISETEAYSDLLRNAAISFKQIQGSRQLDVGNVGQYVDEQLRRMGMDATQAARLWQQVLLSRRLYLDMGNSLFTDPFTFQEYSAYASQSVSGTLYQLPKELRFNSPASLGKFQIYLDAVAQSKKGDNPLKLPETFKSVQEVMKDTPELVQKRYLLDLSETSISQLELMVSLKQMWNWEVDAENWKALTKEFPELALAKATTPEERQKALDDLDKTTRSRIDRAARLAIIEEHPEWVERSLDETTPEMTLVSIPLKGGKTALKGADDRTALITALDNAPLSSQDKTAAPLEYSGDKEHFYRIHVIERSSEPEIMTYAEADRSGVLDELYNKSLKKSYEKIREKYPDDYKNSDGTWKSFDSVSDSVAGRVYNPLIKEMSERFIGGLIPENDRKNLTMSRAASLRFLQHVADAKTSLQSGTVDESLVAQEASSPEQEFPPHQPLADQWKLIEKPYTTTKASQDNTLDKQEAMAMKEGDWSKVYTPPNGDLYFFAAKKRGNEVDKEKLADQVYSMHTLLAHEAERALAENLIELMQKRNALSVSFFKKELKEAAPVDEGADEK